MNTSMICVCAALMMFAVGARAEDGAQEVVQVMHAYEDAWSRHDAHAIAGFYCEPAMRITKDGPAVRETRAVQQGFFGGFLSQLVAKGYDHSAWDRLDVRLLDANTAIASGAVTRYRRDGGVFERQGVSYGLWRSDRGWRIFFSATHDPAGALSFRSPTS
jgi:ketosteroid isomerase-like protein